MPLWSLFQSALLSISSADLIANKNTNQHYLLTFENGGGHWIDITENRNLQRCRGIH